MSREAKWYISCMMLNGSCLRLDRRTPLCQHLQKVGFEWFCFAIAVTDIKSKYRGSGGRGSTGQRSGQ